MAESKPTNQALLLQIVRDIEILRAQSIQILQASQDHETRIRELEKTNNKNSWIPALLTSLLSAAVTSVVVWFISKGLN